jgi:hypothetical protein
MQRTITCRIDKLYITQELSNNVHAKAKTEKYNIKQKRIKEELIPLKDALRRKISREYNKPCLFRRGELLNVRYVETLENQHSYPDREYLDDEDKQDKLERVKNTREVYELYKKELDDLYTLENELSGGTFLTDAERTALNENLGEVLTKDRDAKVIAKIHRCTSYLSYEKNKILIDKVEEALHTIPYDVESIITIEYNDTLEDISVKVSTAL